MLFIVAHNSLLYYFLLCLPQPALLSISGIFTYASMILPTLTPIISFENPIQTCISIDPANIFTYNFSQRCCLIIITVCNSDYLESQPLRRSKFHSTSPNNQPNHPDIRIALYWRILRLADTVPYDWFSFDVPDVLNPLECLFCFDQPLPIILASLRSHVSSALLHSFLNSRRSHCFSSTFRAVVSARSSNV